MAATLTPKSHRVRKPITLPGLGGKQVVFLAAGVRPVFRTTPIFIRAVEQLAWRLTHWNQPPARLFITPTLVIGEDGRG